ncbi:MAG TPA: hypothetical protein VMU05_01365 [Dongiaceae bacterium]|nr:hypothetical protein [Dongiaceae bacterium]
MAAHCHRVLLQSVVSTRIAQTALILLALVAGATAQSRVAPGPPVSAYSPTFDVSCGYAFMSSSIPSASRIMLNGADASIGTDFLPHWGITLDTGYVRTSDVLSTGHPGYTWTFLGGPVFYPLAHGSTRPFLRAMAGAGMVDSAVPVSGGTYVHGWVERPAYSIGGGIQHSFVGPLGIRVGGDYIRTAYADATSTVRAQNNFRLTASVLLRLHYGGHRE